MNFGPMGNHLLHTAALDAAELLDVGLMPHCLQQANCGLNAIPAAWRAGQE